MTMTLMKIRPTISMPVMTFLPSVAASSTARNHCEAAASIAATLTQTAAMRGERDVDRRIAGVAASQPFQRARVVVEP